MKTAAKRLLPATRRFISAIALIALPFTAFALMEKASASQSTPDPIVGAWNLAYDTDENGGQRQGRGLITLVLKREDGKLTGAAFVTGRGGEKHEWKLIAPSLEGEKFSFAVDNGEGLLEGEMRMKEGGFEGTWKMKGIELKGSLKMTRKE